ncbi:hypothetical protein ACFCVY_22635 [Streptomyces sp. NPDC056411]|uniref:hypothetical protein n=1 Tax=Streptomyces sp. NPDC056411 TaxID=3345813 RepID=UPI0035D918E5
MEILTDASGRMLRRKDSRQEPWPDGTTHAVHGSQTLRIERIHDAPAHESAWVMAA